MWRRERSSLRGRLLLALVIAFLPLLALETYLLDAQAGGLRDRIVDQRRALAVTEAQSADGFIVGNVRALQAIAQTPAVRDPSSGRLDGVLRAIADQNPVWTTLGLSASDGFNLSALTTPARSVNISDRDYFQGAVAGKPTVGTAIFARALNVKTVIVAVPVELVSGGRAVLSAALSLAEVEAELRRPLPRGVDLLVVDRRGQQFMGPGVGETFPALTGNSQVDAALGGETGATVAGLAGRDQLIAYAPAEVAGWAVILREPAGSAFAAIDQQRGTALVISGLATIVALLVAMYLGARLEVTYRDVERAGDRLRHILDELPVALAIYDKAGKRVVHNAAFARLFGREVPGTLSDVHREFAVRGAGGRPLGLDELPGQRALRGEIVRAAETVQSNPLTGSDVHTLVNAVPLRDGKEPAGALVVFQDITALKELERERAAFFDMASHEIKTPLTSLLGHVQLARRRIQTGMAENLDDLLERAEEGGQRLAELVRDLLDVSRLDEGRLALSRERVDLARLVTLVVEEVRVALDRHEIVLDAGEPVVVHADPRRLAQIFQNLLDNSVRYSPGGGRIEVAVTREGGDAVVRVTDRGIGIPDEERGKLFQRFFRTSRAQPFGGTGLGLFISRRIAEMHGGTLVLEESGPDRTVFAFSMPVAAGAIDVTPPPVSLQV